VIRGYNYVDVREVALAHIQAMTLPSSVVGNQRFLLTGDEHYNNKRIVEIIRKRFSAEYSSVLPGENVEGGVYPATGFADTDNKKSREVLGIKYRPLEDTIVDTLNALKAAT
jgi:nucleoside-diphosphate-sugar epimerase